MEEQKIEKKEKLSSEIENGEKNHTAIVALVILILVLAIGFRAVYFFKKMQSSNPVKITTNFVEELQNGAQKVLNNNAFKKDSVTSSVIYGNVNDMKFKIESGIDLKNNVLTLLTDLSNGSGSIFYLDGQIDKSNMGLKLDKDSTGYSMASDYGTLFNTLNDFYSNYSKNDSAKYVEYIEDAITTNLAKEDFSKEKETITVFKEEINATKWSTNLDQSKLSNIASSFIDKLASDEDFINSAIDIVKETGEELTKEDIIDSLNDMETEIRESLNGVTLIYTIYTNSSGPVRVAIEGKDQFPVVVFDMLKDEFNASVKYGDFSMSFYYNSKTKEYNFKYNDIAIVEGTYEEKISKNEMSVKISFSIPLANLKGTLNMEVNNVSKIEQKSFAKALDLSKTENQMKFIEELESNEFLNALLEEFGKLKLSDESWTSVDGIDL